MTFTDQVIAGEAVWQTMTSFCDKCGARISVHQVFVPKGQPSKITCKDRCHRCLKSYPRPKYEPD